jgi:hypothetical protein
MQNAPAALHEAASHRISKGDRVHGIRDGHYRRGLVRGHPRQIVQICLGNASTHRIASLLTNRMDEIERFVEENKESVFLLRE